MSRTATDGTRFTQTSPHAYSNPIPNRSSPSNSSTPRSRPQPQRPRNRNNNAPPAGPIETPAQKVARLRAARMAAREAELTRWDRIVLRGRVWADRAHKITALSLIAFTGMSSSLVPIRLVAFPAISNRTPQTLLLCIFSILRRANTNGFEQ